MSAIKDVRGYEILGLVGEGALASVYKVRARKDGAIRALKALRPEQALSVRTVARFEDEYRILSALHHPALPEVHDYGVTADSAPFMVMELIEGVPLDRYVRENPDDLWLLLFQLNEALAFIHGHNLLHLDLKPSNVLVRRTKIFGDEEEPLAMLIDFGLSYRRELGGKAKLTGTPGYMAPEIIRGEENLTRAVDYYSLGVIVYELIEGTLPFRGSVEDILRGHLSESVEFEVRKVEHAELHPWVEKLMSKEPRVRLESFGEFRRAVAARLGEATAAMERVFALGYIDSLGLAGKGDAWEELGSWAASLGERLGSIAKAAAHVGRKAPADAGAGPGGGVADGMMEGERARAGEDASERVRGGEGARKGSTTPADVLKGSASGLEKRIEEDLLSRAAAARPTEAGAIEDLARVIAVSGPPECGKSHVLSTLRNELLVRGVHVVSLGRESDYPALVRGSEDGRRRPRPRSRSEAVDPGSLVIDRYVAAWDQLSDMGRRGGVVVLVDDLARASAEEKEFVEYVGKRIGHELAARNEPGVFIAAVGAERDVRKALLPVIGREGSLSAVEIPPPGKQDADAIAAGFRGGLSGAREEKSLAAYLHANLETSAALYASLKQSVADGALVHEHGRWHFRERMVAPRKASASTLSYYQGVFTELRGVPRALVAVLACHPRALSIEEIEAVATRSAGVIAGGARQSAREVEGATSLSAAKIEAAIDALRPLRVIEIAESGQTRRIGIISDQVREGFRGALGKRERDAIHERLVDYFAAQAGRTVDYFETMAYHYERLGRVRDALVMRIRAVTVARGEKDVFALRRVCEGGVDYSRGLRSSEWKERKGFIERYFIKQWIDSEWTVSNYGNLVKVVEDNYTRRRRQIPVGFLYKYATALERIGKIEACKQVLAEGKRRVKNKKSETYYLLLLEEGSMYYTSRDLENSLNRLSVIPGEALLPAYKGRYYLLLMLGYRALRDHRSSTSFAALASKLSVESRQFDILLRIKYEEVMDSLNTSRYSEARQSAKEGIRLATKYNEQRLLAWLLFIVSAVYYEQAKFGHAMRYLDRALYVAIQNNNEQQINEFMLRYAMIYQNMGRYGDALRQAEVVIGRVGAHENVEQLFYSLLVSLEIKLLIDGPGLDALVEKVQKLSSEVRSGYRLGWYHQLIGDYFRKKRRYSLAVEQYEKAKAIYGDIGYDDDSVRVEIALGETDLLLEDDRGASEIIDGVRHRVQQMQSPDILAEYWVLRLRHGIQVACPDSLLDEFLESCEKIRAKIGNRRVAMKVETMMFEAYVRRGEARKAERSFERYYNEARQIAANLTRTEYIESFIKNTELQEMLLRYRLLKKTAGSY